MFIFSYCVVRCTPKMLASSGILFYKSTSKNGHIFLCKRAVNFALLAKQKEMTFLCFFIGFIVYVFFPVHI